MNQKPNFMKKIYLIVCFLTLLSCSTDDLEIKEESIEENVLTPSEHVKGKLKTIQLFGQPAVVYELKDKYYFQGDIILNKTEIDSTNSLKGAARGNKKWNYQDRKVPYVIESNLSDKQRVYDAIEEIENNSYIDFVPRGGHSDYIKIIGYTPGPQEFGVAYSDFIGKKGGQQIIGLSANATKGNTIHELLHALGFFHEHTRSDRDSIINVHWENIPNNPNVIYQFEKYEDNFTGGFDWGNFDFNSIMMYSSGGTYSNPYMTKLDGSRFTAQRSELSSGDIATLNRLYPKPSPKVILDVTAVHNYSQSKVIDYVYETKWFDSAIQSVEWSGKSEHSPQYYWISNNESTSLILVPSTSGSHYHFMKVKLTTEDGNSYTSGASFYTYEKYTIMALMPPGDPSDPM